MFTILREFAREIFQEMCHCFPLGKRTFFKWERTRNANMASKKPLVSGQDRADNVGASLRSVKLRCYTASVIRRMECNS